MKYKNIVALIEQAGFDYVGEGINSSLAAGRTVAYYKKNSNGFQKECQLIQLATHPENKNDVLPIFSKNVPETFRDAVYKIMNTPSHELPQEDDILVTPFRI